ncbi:hypothetical protein PC129_g22202, partial [Phytophthora cactorum]
MHYASTAKMMERSIKQQQFRRQAMNLLKCQRSPFTVNPKPIPCLAPNFTTRFASTVARHPPEINDKEPTNVTDEPAYKAHFNQYPSRHPLGPTAADGEPIWENP